MDSKIFCASNLSLDSTVILNNGSVPDFLTNTLPFFKFVFASSAILVIKSFDIFDKSVLRAIAKWKFNPDMVDGQPVEKRARQDIKFTLKK